MSDARRLAREAAVQLLYQIDQAEGWDSSFQTCLGLHRDHLMLDGADDALLERLVEGVLAKRKEIDVVIEAAGSNWRIERMAKVDLAVLRMAAYEILWCEDIPVRVSIDEALEATKKFSSDDARKFVNGVLDRIAQSTRD